MKKIFISITIILLSFSLNAKEWVYAPDQIYKNLENTTEVNYEVLEYFVDEIGKHAKSYPPTFIDQKERKNVELILKDLIKKTSKLIPLSGNENLVFYSALLNTMGYNLDIEKTGQTADLLFAYLIQESPKAEYYFYYGGFLGSVPPMQERAIPLLNKAIELGDTRAYYSLGFVYFSKGNNEKALENYKNYKKIDPNNEQVDIIMKGIEDNTAKAYKGFIEDREKEKK
jgi:tetratricopeptide (TPR) repeat protein